MPKKRKGGAGSVESVMAALKRLRDGGQITIQRRAAEKYSFYWGHMLFEERLPEATFRGLTSRHAIEIHDQELMSNGGFAFAEISDAGRNMLAGYEAAKESAA